MRILVIEDESRLASYLKKGLSESGYVVDVAEDGIDGQHLAVEGQYDLVVLDVMLPGIDGFEVLRRLREHKSTPVLMLTARDKVEDRVQGLKGGRTTISSSRSPLPNCSHASRRCCVAAPATRRSR